ncbi:MAG: hypothetical protein HPY74_06180 [Firmicutes bacterium]|nr:hypothetical protein [Bacillota bacterium]
MKKKSIYLIIIFAIIITGLVVFFAILSNDGSEGSLSEDTIKDEGGNSISHRYVKPENAVAYTIMVYMNGSDLESEGGMATGDITEMLSANFPKTDINVIIQTGGTNMWQNEIIPSDKIARYRVIENNIELLEELPAESIGESTTLTSFINYCMDEFPADKYGLIMWNHGGGSVVGYGVDELFNYDSLTINEMKTAFENSYLKDHKLEFLGFDACLMANIETAYMAKDYANYLIASEELEPGYGWDYLTWLSYLGSNPGLNGAEIGREIVDSFVNFYKNNGMEDEATTLSVVDLTKVETVVSALENFIEAADISSLSYQKIAKPRSKTREFGMPSEYGGSTDMVDIVHMAQQFRDICPDEANDLIKAMENAVVYKSQGDFVDNAGGLSLYFPYSAKDEVGERIPIYQTSGFSSKYINYVSKFAEVLTGSTFAKLDVSEIAPARSDDNFDIIIPPEEIDNIESIYFTAWVKEDDKFYTQIYQDSDVEIDENGKILTEFDGIITTINGEWACLYEIEVGDDYIRYGVPALLNDKEVNLIVLYDDRNPEGKVIGAMPIYEKNTGMAPKQLIKIKDGDKIKLLYYAERFVDVDEEASELSEDDFFWYEGDEFTVKGQLVVENWEVEEGVYLYGFTIIDLQGNEYYTDFIEVSY